jgi:hypothetical protein
MKIKKKIFWTIYLVLFGLLTHNCAIGQSFHTLESGTTIKIYSDNTWEEVIADKNNSPYQSLKSKNSSELIRRAEKILALLKSKEVISYIKYFNTSDSLEKIENYQYYSSISQNVLLINQLDLKSKVSLEILERIENDLNINPESPKNPYALPIVLKNTTNTIKKMGCIIKEVSFIDYPALNGISTSFQRLLTYTPTKLANYHKDKPFLTIEVSSIKTSRKYYLDINLIFSSRDVKKSYGSINSDGFIRIEMVNGKTIFTKPISQSTVSIEQYTGKTIYNVKVMLENIEDAKVLEKKYVSEIGIMWSSGFESYPIYNVDFFKTQFSCLDEKQ